jgi:hypothetical protein
MVSSLLRPLHEGLPSKLACADHQGRVEQSTRFEIFESVSLAHNAGSGGVSWKKEKVTQENERA